MNSNNGDKINDVKQMFEIIIFSKKYMQKFILHFGEDPDEKYIYNLIIKAVEIPSDQFEQVQLYLKNNGFDVYPYHPDTIEAIFKQEYILVADAYLQLDKDGWKYRNLENIKINGIVLNKYIGGYIRVK